MRELGGAALAPVTSDMKRVVTLLTYCMADIDDGGTGSVRSFDVFHSKLTGEGCIPSSSCPMPCLITACNAQLATGTWRLI